MARLLRYAAAAATFSALLFAPSALANRVATGLWDTSVAPACVADGSAPCGVADWSSVELGVKFQTSVPINVTGVRFYTGESAWSGNASLWNADGSLLATEGGSASGTGWQTVMFGSPVTMNPGDTFVASYYAPGGAYAFTWDYFTGGSYTTGPVTALGGAGVDGVYSYSSGSTFPTDTFRDTNYWVTPIWIELYDFSGFFAPIDNACNTVKAGSAIPIKFSLNGNQGLDILASGSPHVYPSDACTSTQADPLDYTADTAGNSGLSYDAATDQYTYVWKTQRSWAGTAKRLDVTLDDGTTHSALFTFTK